MVRLHSALVFFGMSAAISCGGRAASEPERAAPPSKPSDLVVLSAAQIRNAGVQSEAVKPESFAPYLAAIATIESDPNHLARVGPRMAGRIIGVRVKLGDTVRRGQILMEVDTVEYHETSQKYFTAVAKARQARLAFDRAKRTLAEGVGTLSEKERAEAAAMTAEADLHEAEEHLHALGLSERDIARMNTETSHGLEHSHVLAPISGRVTTLAVTVGQVVAGPEDLVVIANTDEVWAALRIYERDLGGVTLGIPVEVRVTAFPDRVFSGTVTFLSDVVDPVSRTTEARVRLVNDAGALRPGMTGRALIRLNSGEKKLMLPPEAVQTIEGKTVVFVEAGAGRYRVKEVHAGSEQGGLIPVLEGVEPGERIVTKGAFALRGELERAQLEAD